MSNVPLPESGRLAGVATSAELIAAGIPRGRIRRLVAQGDLLPLGRGVYARSMLAAQLTRDDRGGERLLRLAAAIAVTGPHAAASHHDAAIVHGLALLDRPPAGVVTVTRPPMAPGNGIGRAGIHLHLAALPSSDVIVRRGVPVTSVERTVVDLARPALQVGRGRRRLGALR
jgi:Transcriptional regulator, AbiEi antitoxin